MERVRGSGPAPPLILAGFVLVLSGVVALALAGRPPAAPEPPRHVRPTAGPTAAAAAADPAPFELTTVRIGRPATGATITTDRPVEVRGNGIPGNTVARVLVVARQREVGRGFLTVTPAGRFHGYVTLLPVERPTDARLDLVDAPGGFVLASVNVRLESPVPITVAHPRPEASLDLRSGVLTVDGTSLATVREVSASLITARGAVVARATVRTRPGYGGWRTFELSLPLSNRARDARELRVRWPTRAGARSIGTLSIPLRSADGASR